MPGNDDDELQLPLLCQSAEQQGMVKEVDFVSAIQMLAVWLERIHRIASDQGG
jgi:hypothetical protein